MGDELNKIDLTIAIPLYNEESRVPLIEREVREFLERSRNLSTEIIFVNDGSRDRTHDAVDALAKRLRSRFSIQARIVDLATNRGKGAALRAAVEEANGNWILTADADMAAPVTQLLDWEKEGRMDLRRSSDGIRRVYFASRSHSDSEIVDGRFRRLLGHGFNFLVQMFASVYVRDTQCGFKVYPRHIAKRVFAELFDFGWAHDVALCKLVQEGGGEIVSVPVKWTAQAGSKLRPFKDAFRMFAALFRIRILTYWRCRLGMGRRPWSEEESFGARNGRVYYWAWLFLLLILGSMIVLTFRDYGITTDETVQKIYGELVLKWYASFFGDWSVVEFLNLWFYGGFFEVVLALAVKVSPLGLYETRHLVSAFFGLFGIVGTWKIAHYLLGARAALWAAFFLSLVPTYYGLMFNNSKDIPFAVGYIWSLYYLVQMIPFLPRIPLGLAVKFGIAVGVTLGIRVGAVLILGYFGLIVFGYLAIVWFRRRTVSAVFWNLVLMARTSVVGLGIAYGLMLFFWPWSTLHPLMNPVIGLREMSRFPLGVNVLYRGNYVPSKLLPWDYIPFHLFVNLPEIVILFFLVFCGMFAACLIWKRFRSVGSVKTFGLVVILFSALFPIVYGTVRGVVLYDGIRHFIFVIPPIACLSGIAVACVMERARRISVLHLAFSAALAVALTCHVTIMARLHPNEYVYYNRVVGGLSGASGRFELDYWSNSIAEAVRNLVIYLKDEMGEKAFLENRFKVGLCSGSPPTASEFLPKNMSLTQNTAEADFFISWMRRNCDRAYEGKTISIVERMGVPLALVKDRRHLLGKHPVRRGFLYETRWEYGDVVPFDYEDSTISSKSWKALPASAVQPDSRIDLASMQSDSRESRCVFLRQDLNFKKAVSGKIYLGSDDGYMLWLNGRLIRTLPISRPLNHDTDTIPASFDKGSNRVVLKVCNIRGGWFFTFRYSEDILEAREWTLEDFKAFVSRY